MTCDELLSCFLELPGAIPQYYLRLRGWEEPGCRILGKGSSHHLLSVLFSTTQIEDGGKAALSQKMKTGDELVNINGTPLYGSRQEALILIKGSFRILKLIVRRVLAGFWSSVFTPVLLLTLAFLPLAVVASESNG